MDSVGRQHCPYRNKRIMYLQTARLAESQQNATRHSSEV